MLGLFAAPFTKLIQLDFFSYEFFILTGPVIRLFASPASEFD